MATGSDIPKSMYEQLQNVTLVTPPVGVGSDISQRQFHGHPMLIAASVCLPLVLILAAIRVFVRLRILRKWGLDDYAFITSVPAGVSLISLNLALIYGGAFGYHAWEVTIGDLSKAVLERSVAVGVIQGHMQA
ncbi:hypothetical protein P171DRAFT_520724 [Karstenula rhodostoma CBS 690.94]|uniref:Uncharacterized protein n=1 Tax=Karstenula rhodostoma CBS 690.94 TaxID=1392251 RepID=A0A9P4PK00_9PLEO|nr:hypothetical protein P171DRAFT_520724 [Karstenula rhodostoma CBS 690.94]